MSKSYTFQTSQFGTNNEGLYLLRNRFNYESYTSHQMVSLALTPGKEYKNWKVLIVLGIAFISFAIYYSIGVLAFFNQPKGGRIYIEELLVPFFPTCIGLYLLFISFKKTINLVVVLKNKSLQLSLTELILAGQLEAFEDYLELNYSDKLK